MAFEVLFGKTNKRINSTKQPELTTTVNCNLKSGTSSESPTFELQGNIDFSWNYAYCETFKRYYFINDITYDKSVYYISCSCDVLATAKDDIINTSTFLERCPKAENPHMVDGLYPVVSNPIVRQNISTLPLSNVGSIIVCTAGAHGNVFHVCTVAQYAALCNYLYSDDYMDALTEKVKIGDLIQKEIADPSSCILSTMWIPFDLGGGSDTITLGYVSSGVGGTLLTTNTVTSGTVSVDIPRHQNASGNFAYLQYEPFSNYYLVVPCVGIIPVKSDILFGATKVSCYYALDTSGKLTLHIFTDNSRLIGDYTANIGCPIGYSSRTGAVTSAINSIATMFGGAVKGIAESAFNPVGGIVNGVSSIVGGAIDLYKSSFPAITSTGGGGGWTGNTEFACRVIYYNINNVNPELYGYCLYQNVPSLKSYTGFVKARNFFLQTNKLTKNETLLAENYLNGGVYIE